MVSQSGARGTGEGSHRAEEVTDIPEEKEKENLIIFFHLILSAIIVVLGQISSILAVMS